MKPSQGREKPWHQDCAFFNLALDTPIVGVWIPMGEVTPENGYKHLLAGGHKAGARIHFKRRDWQICDTDVPTTGRVAVPMGVGDVLLFDGKLPHGTPINRADDFRWAVQYHYRAADTVQVDDACAWPSSAARAATSPAERSAQPRVAPQQSSACQALDRTAVRCRSILRCWRVLDQCPVWL